MRLRADDSDVHGDLNRPTINDVSRDDHEEEKKGHLFVREHNAPVAVQGGLEGESTHADVVP